MRVYNIHARVVRSNFPVVNTARNSHLVGICVAILYFEWEDQSEKVYCIVHTVVINCMTVLYKPYSTVMCLIAWAYAALLRMLLIVVLYCITALQ